MISTNWTAAPAGFLGLGCSDVRANVDVFATVGTGGAAARLRPTTSQVVPAERLHVIAPDYFAQNDGTTLGISSSWRPQS